MTEEFNHLDLLSPVPCDCSCHAPGASMIHCLPCCQGKCRNCGRPFKRGLRGHEASCVMGEDWWAASVKEIYTSCLHLLAGKELALTDGPGHIVWSDGNFDDDSILYCLGLCESARFEFEEHFDTADLVIVRQSLERLLLIPEEVREHGDQNCDE